MKNIFKNLFSKREKEAIAEIQPQKELDRIFVEKVIKKLESPGNTFSARWFDRKQIEPSVRTLDKNVIIMIETAQIVAPFKPEMTNEQRETIKELIKPIVEKDIKYIVDTFI